MALIDTVGAANRGYAQGALDYNTFMQTAANVNELMANDKQRQLMMQIQQPGLVVPQVTLPRSAAGPAPSLPGEGIGLQKPPLERTPGPRTQSDVDALYEGMYPINAPKPIQLTGPIPQKPGLGGFEWAMPSKDYYPDQQFLPVGPNQTVLQNTAAKLGNKFLNLPGDIYNISANVIERPFVNAWQYLTTPEGQLGVVAPPETSANVVFGSPVPATTGAGVVAPSPAPGSSSPSSPSLTPTGLSAPGSTSGAAGASSPEEEFLPREVRNAILQAPPEELNYLRDQLLAQRDEITRATNERIALAEQQAQQVAAQTQTQINMLTQYAEAARQAGNVGQMVQYRNQADALLADATTAMQTAQSQALDLQQAARAAYMENDLKLWTQQAAQAEYEFRNMGDPTRMTQIMAAYGIPVAIEDAGDGNYRIIDITGDGRGTRRKGTFTSQQVADMFMSTISEAFRAQKIAEQTAIQQQYLEHSFELDKIDAQAAADIQKKMAETNLSLDDYGEPKELANGDVIIVPKKAFGAFPTIRYLAEPPVNEDGVPESRVQLEFSR